MTGITLMMLKEVVWYLSKQQPQTGREPSQTLHIKPLIREYKLPRFSKSFKAKRVKIFYPANSPHQRCCHRRFPEYPFNFSVEEDFQLLPLGWKLLFMKNTSVSRMTPFHQCLSNEFCLLAFGSSVKILSAGCVFRHLRAPKAELWVKGLCIIITKILLYSYTLLMALIALCCCQISAEVNQRNQQVFW